MLLTLSAGLLLAHSEEITVFDEKTPASIVYAADGGVPIGSKSHSRAPATRTGPCPKPGFWCRINPCILQLAFRQAMIRQSPNLNGQPRIPWVG